MSATDLQNSMNSPKDAHFSLEKPAACNIGRTTFPIASSIQQIDRRPHQQPTHQHNHHQQQQNLNHRHHHLHTHPGNGAEDNVIGKSDHQKLLSIEPPTHPPTPTTVSLGSQDLHHHHQQDHQDYQHHQQHPYQPPLPPPLPQQQQTTKSFTCNICGKTLSRRDHLKLHTTIHTGIRPYRCMTCGVSFSRNHHLVRHMGSHMSEKRYKCDICGKGLSRSDHLKVHRRIHTGERPFKCQICGFAFSRRDRLVKHNQLNKGRRKLSCVPPSFASSVSNSEDRNSLQLSSQEQLNINLTNESNFTSHQIHRPNPSIIEDVKVQLSPKPQKRDANENEKPDNSQVAEQNQELNSDLNISSVSHPNATSSQIDQVVSPDDLSVKMSQFPSLIAAGNGHQMQHMMPVFPTTIQMSPATAHVFPTLQMYANTPQISLPLIYTSQNK